MYKIDYPDAHESSLARALLWLGVVVLGGAVLALAYWLLAARPTLETDDARVRGALVWVSAQTQGEIARVLVEEGQRVEAGQVLLELDPVAQQMELEDARSVLAAAVRQARSVQRAAQVSEDDLAARRATVEQMRKNLARRSELARTGAVSARELAQARSALANAQAALEASLAAEAGVRSQLIDRATLLETPPVARAAARLRTAFLAHRRTQVRAPISGYVAECSAHAGERVAADDVLLTVAALNTAWVEARFPENQLARLYRGQGAELVSELYGSDVIFHGKLARLGAVTEETLRAADEENGAEHWQRRAARVPVRIELDAQELAAHPLLLGLRMSVRVNTHDTGSGEALTLDADAPDVTRSLEAPHETLLQEAADEVERVLRAHLGEEPGEE
ncbi:MAG: efflux RND transporter periplasmic adaptor subunit, partial [Rhodocyclaceae bacterium]|nr:efflux RND transporter periplasmic adaptor subunit [Rhodocyclaceae bacterium]